MRTITLFTTYGGIKKIETDVQTWGELKDLAEAQGIDTSRLIATESVRKTDLNHAEASLPEENFTVFFRKAETKAGADFSQASYRDCRNEISEIYKRDENAKDHFNQGGKNYTNKSTEELRSLITSYYASQEVAEEITEEVQPGVEEVATPSAQEEVVPEGQHISLKEYLNEVARVLENIELDEEDEELSDRVEFLAGEAREVSDELSDETIIVFQDTNGLFTERASEVAQNRELTEEEILQRQFEELERNRR
jgi:hypothetical protein